MELSSGPPPEYQEQARGPPPRRFALVEIRTGRPHGVALRRDRRNGLAVLLLEALDAAGGVDELLLTRVERVTAGADFDHERTARGVGLGLVTARASDHGRLVLGMNALF